MENYKYIGSELELFSNALNWKMYFMSKIKNFINGNVLEVGAGLGSNSKYISKSNYETLTCLEPDDSMFKYLCNQSDLLRIKDMKFLNGTLSTLSTEYLYDTIIYLDVLEHIENDREELEIAYKLLNPQGHLIILSPAHQWLYTPFDASIGHFRRYSKATLKQVVPKKLEIVKLHYLDSMGLFASLANKLLLKQRMPTINQIAFWDKFIIRFSRVLDFLIMFSLGKSVLFIGKKSMINRINLIYANNS